MAGRPSSWSSWPRTKPSQSNRLMARHWSPVRSVALVSSSFLFDESGNLTCDQLDQVVFPAYVAGLRDAGWHGARRLVRLAFTGSLAMRYLVGTLRTALPVLASPHAEAIIGQAFGTTLAQLTERVARHNAWAFARADEFQRLVSVTPDLPNAARLEANPPETTRGDDECQHVSQP